MMHFYMTELLHKDQRSSARLQNYQFIQNSAYSSSLNPIEMIWAILKRDIAAHTRKTRFDLINITRKVINLRCPLNYQI